MYSPRTQLSSVALCMAGVGTAVSSMYQSIGCTDGGPR